MKTQDLGFWASTCAGLSIHAPMAPPHFQGSVGGVGSSHCLAQYGCKGWRVSSSVSDCTSNGWERPKQAGWEFRFEDLEFRVYA